MKKTAIFLTMITIFASTSLFATRWARTFSQVFDESARSVVATKDGGYFLAGYIYSFYELQQDILAVKLTAAGQIAWAKSLDKNSYESAQGFQTKDGGYLLWGSTGTHSSSDDAFIVKLSGGGKMLWQKSFGNAKERFSFSAIREIAGGGFIACGDIDLLDNDNCCLDCKGWLVKLNASGKSLWQRTFTNSVQTGTKYFSATDVLQTRNGNFVFLGCDYLTTDTGYARVWLAEFSPSGALLWEKAYEYPSESGYVEVIMGQRIIETADGGFLIAAQNQSWRPYGSLCFKTDAAGKVAWCQRFERDIFDYFEINDIIQDKKGNYILAAALLRSYLPNSAWVGKLDPNGKLVFQKSFRMKDEADAGFIALCQARDDDYVLAGYSETDVYTTSQGENIISEGVLFMKISPAGTPCAGLKPKDDAAYVKSQNLNDAVPTVAISKKSYPSVPSSFSLSTLSLQKTSFCPGAEVPTLSPGLIDGLGIYNFKDPVPYNRKVEPRGERLFQRRLMRRRS